MRPLFSTSAAPGRPQAHPTGTARSGRRDSDLAGVFGRRPISRALALVLPLALGACAADEIEARAVLEDYGLRGVSVTLAPSFGRPCAWGEPYALRFTGNVGANGLPVTGVLCSADERAQDARMILDRGGA